MKKIFTILGIAFALSVNAQVTINPSATAICQGNSVTFIANAASYGNDTLNFTWLQNGIGFGMPNNDTITYTPAVGSWNVTVNVTTPGGQFVGTGFATLTVNSLPTSTATNSGPHCVNQTINLTAGGGTSYGWSGPGGFSSNQQNPQLIATSAANGTYTVTVTDNNGCSTSASTNVVVNPLPIPIAGSNSPVCVGGIIGLTTSGGVSYVWSGPVAYSSNVQNPIRTNATPSMGGTYTVTVTNNFGCSASASTNVVVNPTPAVTAVANPVSCFGDSTGSVSVSAQNGAPFSYLWSNGATTQSINNLPAGNYNITVTNSFGCTATTVANVNQPLAVVTASLVVTNVSCNGGSNGSIGVNSSGGVAPYNYSWTGNGTGGNPRTNLAAGTYTVTVTDANGCTTSATGTVGQPAPLTANADSIPVNCNGLADGGAFVSFISGGTPPFTYLWSNGATGSSTTGLTTGTYTVTITDANGCQVSAGTVVTQPAAITLSAQVTSVTCNGGNNGSIDLTVSGGTSPYTYLWSNGSNVQDPSGLVAGTKSVTVTDANGCTAISSWVVNQPTVLILNISTTSATCLGNGNGSASVSVSGGNPPYSYSWTGGGTNNSINAPAGNYTVTVTDGNGCQALALATIGTAVPVTASAVVTPISCYAGNNGAIDLTVTGVSPFMYVWSNGATTQDITGLGWGNYTVTITATNGCIHTQSFALVQPAPLTASASATNALCFGGLGSATVLATGGTGNYTFAWSPQGGTGSSANNLPAGAYTVTVTDANGCSLQANTVVTQPSQMLAVISNQTNIACAGNSNGSATASVVGGTPFSGGSYNFLWSNGSQLNQAFGLSAGTHTVTVTDANGCTASTTATISSTGSTLYANMTSQPSCGNSNTGSVTASVSSGQQPYVYQWSNGATSPSISGLAPGNYSVIITDANGCTWSGSQQILGSPQMYINLSNQVVCEGNNGQIDANFTGGTWPYQFIWTTPNGNIFTTHSVNDSEHGTYNVVITDAFDCQISGSMFNTVIPCATTTSVESILNGDGVKLFPNPISFGGDVTIALPSIYNDVTIQVFDLTGKILSQEKAIGEIHQLNTSGLAAGTYMVRIASGDDIVVKRIVIQ
jgi:hypothetical protein